MNLGFVVGEASGDHLGAGLISALKPQFPQIQANGIAGPAMMSQGCHSLYDMDRLAVMGLVEPLFRIPELLKIRHNLYQHFQKNRPDIFIGIDSPDFNLSLEHKLKKSGIPVIHYVSPSVWAWRQKRIFKIAKATDLVLTLFPFESKFYEKYNVPSQFVGHPVADLIPLEVDKKVARKALGLDPDATYIALLPGSRKGEIKNQGAPFLGAAKICLKKYPNLKFITSSINEHRAKELKLTWESEFSDLPLEFFQRRSHEVMAASDLVVVTAGTATLETMLFKKPMVVTYKMAPMSFAIMKHLVNLKYISLPNLLADELLVSELVQNDVTAEKISREMLYILNHPEKNAELEKKFLAIHHLLRRNANQQAAQAVLSLYK